LIILQIFEQKDVTENSFDFVHPHNLVQVASNRGSTCWDLSIAMEVQPSAIGLELSYNFHVGPWC
jgi:hypothetical protein